MVCALLRGVRRDVNGLFARRIRADLSIFGMCARLLGPPATAGSRQTGLPTSLDPLQMATLRCPGAPSHADPERNRSPLLFRCAQSPAAYACACRRPALGELLRVVTAMNSPIIGTCLYVIRRRTGSGWSAGRLRFLPPTTMICFAIRRTRAFLDGGPGEGAAMRTSSMFDRFVLS